MDSLPCRDYLKSKYQFETNYWQMFEKMQKAINALGFDSETVQWEEKLELIISL